jgi:hypothetical protein
MMYILVKSTCLILDILHRLCLLVSDRSSVLSVVSVKSDPFRPSGLASVKFDYVSGRLGMNDLVGGVGLS